MSITDEQFAAIVTLIQDGEIDDHMIALQKEIDDRNLRRQDDILKLVRSVWGPDAQVISETGHVKVDALATERQRPTPRPLGAPADAPRPGAIPYVPDVGPAIPSGAGDPMADPGWPTPITSMSGAGGTGFSPVGDPMSGGNDDIDTVNTGAQFG